MARHLHENSKDVSGASARRLWFRSDIIVVIIFLLIAAVIYLVYAAAGEKNGTPYCEIVLDGEVVMTVVLAEDKSFSLEQLPNVVFEIKDGAIAFVKSDCPDKICIHSGYLHQSGQTAACLPNLTAIRIKASGAADEPDIVI